MKVVFTESSLSLLLWFVVVAVRVGSVRPGVPTKPAALTSHRKASGKRECVFVCVNTKLDVAVAQWSIWKLTDVNLASLLWGINMQTWRDLNVCVFVTLCNPNIVKDKCCDCVRRERAPSVCGLSEWTSLFILCLNAPSPASKELSLLW